MSKRRATPSPLLPPLDAAAIYGPLDAPDELRDLGDAANAEKGLAYRHRVEFAIMTLSASLRPASRWTDRLNALFDHPDAGIRQSAILAYSKIGPDRVLEALIHIARDASQPKQVRESAALSASFSHHPRAWIFLHEVALDPTKDHWSAAISRLGDVGDAFTVELLSRRIDAKTLDTQQRKTLYSNLARIEGPLLPEKTEDIHKRARQLVERQAWGRVDGSMIGAELRTWILVGLRAEMSREILRVSIASMRDRFKVQARCRDDDERSRVSDLAREFCRELYGSPR